MLEFKAADFFRVTTAIQHTLSVLETKKKRSFEHHEDGSVTITPIDDQVFLNTLVERCEELGVSLRVLGADITLMAVCELDLLLQGGSPTYEGIVTGFIDIQRTLNRELTKVKLLALSSEEYNWFSPKEHLFGAKFNHKFRTRGVFEVDEAAKCLALGRPTAAVFHLMRVLEVGIYAFANCLVIPDPVKPAERNWGVFLRKIREEGIEKKWPTAADRMCGEAVLFESLHASLDAVKNPWRNESLHVGTKYTDDEAKHIFSAVKGFMSKLASRMDENGEPKA